MNQTNAHDLALAQGSKALSTRNSRPRKAMTARAGSGHRLRALAGCGLLAMLLPVAALADGRVISSTAFPANITMPDQQALIHFTNGTERLVIETRFTGAGTNFAWVVPLPSQPVVEGATTGLFPTLHYLFQPRVIHRVPHYYVGILMMVLLAVMLRAALRAGLLAVLVFILGILLLAALLLPALARAKTKGMAGTAAGAVSILDRSVAGVFDTTTIASRDPKALQTWLLENGFEVSAEVGPTIESYVKEGWVFVAAKVRRDAAVLQTSTPHPLSFTFKTSRPVYPMRLTGVNNGPLSVELYVFGPARASAPHFKVERCARPGYPEATGQWSRFSPGTPHIVHPLLHQWVGGAPVATKLTATLTPADMRQDVWLKWSRFREKKNELFSPAGARTYALNRGAGLFAAVVCIGFVAAAASEKGRRGLGKPAAVAAMAGAALAGLLYLGLPKTEVRLVRMPGSVTYGNLYYPFMELQGETNLTLTRARAVLAELASYLTKQPRIRYNERYERSVGDNLLLGGKIHEEDSPGNYTLRETDDGLEYVTYDAQGAEHVLGQLPRQAK